MTTAASAAAKGVSVITNLITVPLTLSYLGPEEYGLWIAITSIFLILGVADFGVGNGLLNMISAAHGKDDRRLVARHVSTAFGLFLIIGFSIGLLLFAVKPFISVHSFFNVPSGVSGLAVDQAIMVLVGMFAVSLPFTVILRLQEGLQEGFSNYLVQIVGNVLSLALIIGTIKMNLGLRALVFSLLAGPLFANLLGFVVQFGFRKKWARPSIAAMDKGSARTLLSTGGLFFGLTVLTVLGMQTDALIIARVNGPEAVTPFSVVQRLSQIAFLYWAFLQALWPAYGEAVARNDFDWVRKTIVRSLKLSLLFGSLFAAILFFFGGALIKIWLKESVSPSSNLLLSFSVFILTNSVVGVIAVVFNSTSLLRKQLVLLAFAAGASFILKILLCKIMGAPGAVWATVIGFTLFFIVPGLRIIRKTYWSSLTS
ncbi:MAG: oligosaccharide flippase family protein [Verrucomicrobia bacterium]|nr:oligosaccharide flippase family protein [Verrucomicrobiota bacterium]